MLIRLVGAAVLVGCAIAGAQSYRADVAGQLVRVQHWCETLAALREGVRGSGAPLPELLRTALAEDMPADACAQETLAALCERMAADLEGNIPAAQHLCTLADAFAQTDSAQPLLSQLDEAIAAMQSRRSALQEHLEKRCRAVSTLCVCGALALIVTLW